MIKDDDVIEILDADDETIGNTKVKERKTIPIFPIQIICLQKESR